MVVHPVDGDALRHLGLPDAFPAQRAVARARDLGAAVAACEGGETEKVGEWGARTGGAERSRNIAHTQQHTVKKAQAMVW